MSSVTPTFPSPSVVEKDTVVDAQSAANLRRLQALEQKAKAAGAHTLGSDDEDMDVDQEAAPLFLTRLREGYVVEEGRKVHFEAKLTPITDPNLKVKWLKDGAPMAVGHRFRPIHDFGYVALDIVDVIAEDTGRYTCRATNLAGTAEIETRLECKSKLKVPQRRQNSTTRPRFMTSGFTVSLIL